MRPRKAAEAGAEGTASGSRSGRGRGAAAQPYPWRCRSCCGGLASLAPRSRRRELRTRRSSASKLSTTGLPRATVPKKAACGACGSVARGDGPAGSAMLGSARPGPGADASLSPGNGRGQRPRGAALGKAGGTAGGGFSTACFTRDGTVRLLIVSLCLLHGYA